MANGLNSAGLGGKKSLTYNLTYQKTAKERQIATAVAGWLELKECLKNSPV